MFHLSDGRHGLVGKIMLRDLRAGDGPDLGLHRHPLARRLFFALGGGYAMGMYLMREIGRDGQYHSDMPDFMVFLNWKGIPLALGPWSDSFAFQMAMVLLVPALLAFAFGFFALLAHQGRVLLHHHAGDDLRGDAALLPQRDGLRRQQRLHRLQALLGIPIATRAHGAVRRHRPVLIGFWAARFLVAQVRPRAAAIRDAESRVMFTVTTPSATS